MEGPPTTTVDTARELDRESGTDGETTVSQKNQAATATTGGAIMAEMPDNLYRDCKTGNSRPVVRSKVTGVEREVVRGTHLGACPNRMV